MKLSRTLCLFALVMSCCEPVFIPDPMDPRLPRYSETGNNVAGAFVDEDVWASRFLSDQPSIDIFPQRDSVVIIFEGDLLVRKAPLTFIFSLQNTGLRSIDGLGALSNQKFLIDGQDNSAYIDHVCEEEANGQFYLKNVTPLRETGYIISGTFGFQTAATCLKPQKIAYGRFDYKINNSDVRVHDF